MLQFRFKGPWEKVRRELQDHEAELGGHEVELTVAETPESLLKQESGETLAEALKDYIGIVKSGKGHERLSENCGEKFTDYLEEKRRKGDL